MTLPDWAVDVALQIAQPRSLVLVEAVDAASGRPVLALARIEEAADESFDVYVLAVIVDADMQVEINRDSTVYALQSVLGNGN